MIKFFSLLLLVLFYSASSFAISDSYGTKFVFSFLPSYYADGELAVFISSKNHANGVIEIDSLGYTQQFSVSPNSTEKVIIPKAAQVHGRNTDTSRDPIISHRSIKIVSDRDITVTGLNWKPGSSDTFLVYPSDVLDTDYQIIAYKAGVRPSQAIVVATQDHTSVSVKIDPRDSKGFDVILDEGEVFYMEGYQFAGAQVSADFPIAVLGGGRCVNVPSIYGCDHLAEMIPPKSRLLTQWVSVPLATRKAGDVFLVSASEFDSSVFINGEEVGTSGPGREFYETILTEASIIETTSPSIVAQYSQGVQSDDVSDPFMSLLLAPDQFSNSYVFYSPGLEDVEYDINFINVVADEGDIDTFYLDGAKVPVESFERISDSQYYGAQISLREGSHYIYSQGRFGLNVYGLGVPYINGDAFGHIGGISFEQSVIEHDPYPPIALVKKYSDFIILRITDSEDVNVDGVLQLDEDLNNDGIINQRTEDLNNDGQFSEGEDLNGNGKFDKDTGVFTIELSDDSENLELDLTGFKRGALSATVVLTRVDPDLPAYGAVIVKDGVGNATNTDVNFDVRPSLSDVSVVSTFSNQGIELVEDSFSSAPTLINSTGDMTEVVWSFDQFPADKVEHLAYDLIVRDPFPGESRLVLNDIQLSYLDVNGNPVLVSLGSQAVTVAPSIFTLATSVDKANYLEDESISMSHTITNLADFDDRVRLRIRIEDSYGSEVDDVLDTYEFIEAGSSITLSNTSYNVGNIATGDYKVIAELLNDDSEVVRSSQASFSVVTPSGGYIDLASSVTSIQPSYAPWDAVRLNAKLQNMASNSTVGEFLAEIKVRAPGGQLIYSDERLVSSLSPLAVQQFYFDASLVGASEGTYQITWTAKGAESGELLTTSLAQFEVIRQEEQELVGTASSDASRVFHTSDNQCHFSLLNRGSSAYEDLLVAKSIVHVDSEQLVDRNELLIDLEAGEDQHFNSTFSASRKPYGGYACILEASIDGVWKVLASAIFEVQAPLITTTANIGNQERLLVLTDEPRQCSAFEDIHLGAEFGAELSLNNEITVRLLNENGVVLDTEVITAFDLNINQSYGTPTEPDLAVKASASGELEFILTKSGGMPHNRYQVEVKVKKSWLTTVEKSWSIDSSCDRPLTIGELYEDLTLLDWDIWTSDSDLRDVDPYGPTSGPDLNTQNDFIKDLLDTAGWEYTLVHTPEDFAYEHRTGDYGSYLILSERPQLHWKVQKEIREAVVSGKGLLVAGAYDKRNHWLEPALGMDVIGHHPWAREVNTGDDLFTASVQVPFAYQDRVQGIWLDGASVIGEYTLAADQSEGWTWLDQHSFVLDDILSFKRKAITQYEYGHGRSLFFGFDLLLEASAGGSQSAYSNLLRESIDWIQPTISDELYPGSVVPVDITWTNNRGAVDAYTELNTSGEARIVAADDFALDATPIAATFSMGEGEVRDQTVYVELSSEPAQQLRVATTTVDGDQRTVQAEALLDLNTTERPSLEATQAELDSLAWQYWYRVDYRSAWLKYKLARSAFEAGYYNEAQGLFLIAADLLMDSDEPDVIAARKSLYSHIETTGRKLALDQ